MGSCSPTSTSSEQALTTLSTWLQSAQFISDIIACAPKTEMSSDSDIIYVCIIATSSTVVSSKVTYVATRNTTAVRTDTTGGIVTTFEEAITASATAQGVFCVGSEVDCVASPFLTPTVNCNNNPPNCPASHCSCTNATYPSDTQVSRLLTLTHSPAVRIRVNRVPSLTHKLSLSLSKELLI